jgi:hypothetical protein
MFIKMSFVTSSKSLLSALILSICLVGTRKVDAALEKYEMHFANCLPYDIRIRCQSKDKDSGLVTLHPNIELHWRFRMNIWGSTLYFCHFYTDTKDKVFDVFNEHIGYDYCGTSLNTNICNWLVKEDGFYITNKLNPIPGDLTKMYSW